jgi:glucose-1-phosphate adenylyltransferase
VRVNSYCEVEYSILMPNVEIGRYSRIRRAMIDTNVKIPESSVIGFNAEDDRRNGYHVTDSNVVVVSDAPVPITQSARSVELRRLRRSLESKSWIPEETGR